MDDVQELAPYVIVAEDTSPAEDTCLYCRCGICTVCSSCGCTGDIEDCDCRYAIE